MINKRIVFIYYTWNMQELGPVNPQLFIANRIELQQYKCALCFELSLNMRKCAGACQKNMCTSCLRQYPMKTRCPICKEKFQIEDAVIPQIRFVCPSFSPQCAAENLSKEEFFEHAAVCPFISESQRAQFRYKSSYQCQCSGTLRIYYDERTCCECNLTSSCSKCSKCHKKYCLQCRKPPIRKQFCTKGHRFIKEIVSENDTVCDLCELPIFNFKLRTKYADPQCEFDVCYICIDTLPEERPEPFLEQSSEEEDDRQSSGWEGERNYEEDEEDSEEDEDDSEDNEDSEEENESPSEDSQEDLVHAGEEDWVDEDEEDDQDSEDDDEQHQSDQEEQEQQPSCARQQNGPDSQLENDQNIA